MQHLISPTRILRPLSSKISTVRVEFSGLKIPIVRHSKDIKPCFVRNNSHALFTNKFIHNRTVAMSTSGAGEQNGNGDSPKLKVVLVVAAALIDSEGQVLLAQRPEGKSMAGLWEFPGGKVEDGETPEAALVRELREELDVETECKDLVPITFASHTYEKFHLLMPVFACYKWSGDPMGLEGQLFKWVAARDMELYPMPPADIPLLGAIEAAALKQLR